MLLTAVCSSVQLYRTIGVAIDTSHESTSRCCVITHRDTLLLHDDSQPTGPRQHPCNAVPHLCIPLGHDVNASPLHGILDHHDYLHRGNYCLIQYNVSIICTIWGQINIFVLSCLVSSRLVLVAFEK